MKENTKRILKEFFNPKNYKKIIPLLIGLIVGIFSLFDIKVNEAEIENMLMALFGIGFIVLGILYPAEEEEKLTNEEKQIEKELNDNE